MYLIHDNISVLPLAYTPPTSQVDSVYAFVPSELFSGKWNVHLFEWRYFSVALKKNGTVPLISIFCHKNRAAEPEFSYLTVFFNPLGESHVC